MVRLFHVRGIAVRLDAGWLVIFGLVAWSLARAYFPRALPGLSPPAYWAHGVAAALLLFASVLVHELAHALVALAQGVRVPTITLHLLGGVAQMDREPPSPRAEMVIAAAGPLVSLALGLTVLGAHHLIDRPVWAAPLLSYLGGANLVLGLFNLLPGFPLDGGRLLRAALWGGTGRIGWATRIAGQMGCVCAMALVGLGMFSAFAGDGISGLWLVLLGLFLNQAARHSVRAVTAVPFAGSAQPRSDRAA